MKVGEYDEALHVQHVEMEGMLRIGWAWRGIWMKRNGKVVKDEVDASIKWVAKINRHSHGVKAYRDKRSMKCHFAVVGCKARLHAVLSSVYSYKVGEVCKMTVGGFYFGSNRLAIACML